jgi:putative DNA primase/helicase
VPKLASRLVGVAQTLLLEDEPLVSDVAPQVETADDVKLDPSIYLHTDAGNALLFRDLYKEKLRYIEKRKYWVVWNGSRWDECSDIAMIPMARELTEFIFARAADSPYSGTVKVLREYAMLCQKDARLRAMINLAKGEPELRIEANELDANIWLLGTPNGTLDLKTGKLREARREDFITMSIAVAYDGKATCPNFLGFLKKITGGDSTDPAAQKAASDHIDYLQRAAGYALTGSVIEEKLIIPFGGGDNGKTTLFETLLKLMGDYARAVSADLIMRAPKNSGSATPDIIGLKGRRLIIVNETQENDRLNEARIKYITSTATLEGRDLYEKKIPFYPTHKVVIPTNHLPVVQGNDRGIWKRLVLLPFTVTIGDGEKEMNFREKRLTPELAGILNWMLEGCRKWREEGLKAPVDVAEAHTKYRDEMDILGTWINEKCVADGKAVSKRNFMYASYVDWIKNEGQFPLGSQKFGKALQERGFPQGRGTTNTTVIHGLRLRGFTDDKPKQSDDPEGNGSIPIGRVVPLHRQPKG